MAVLLFLHLYDAFYEILQSLTFLGQTHRVIRLLVTRVIVIKRNKFKCILSNKFWLKMAENAYTKALPKLCLLSKIFDKLAKLFQNPLVFYRSENSTLDVP